MMNFPDLKVFGKRKVPTKLQSECGVTGISLDNALFLMSQHGCPNSIELIQEPNEWHVRLDWEKVFHTFSGFSWGYGGEGPHGFMTLLISLGLNDIAMQVPKKEFENRLTQGPEDIWVGSINLQPMESNL
jgi:hypothetical protein